MRKMRGLRLGLGMSMGMTCLPDLLTHRYFGDFKVLPFLGIRRAALAGTRSGRGLSRRAALVADAWRSGIFFGEQHVCGGSGGVAAVCSLCGGAGRLAGEIFGYVWACCGFKVGARGGRSWVSCGRGSHYDCRPYGQTSAGNSADSAYY